MPVNKDYDYQFKPKSIDRMPPGLINLYGIKPINGFIPVVITFKYIDDTHALLRASVDGIQGPASSITCSAQEVGNLAIFYLNERKKYIHNKEFRVHAMSLARDIADQLRSLGYSVLSPSAGNDYSGYTGMIKREIYSESSNGKKKTVVGSEIAGTFEKMSIFTPEILLEDSKTLSVTLSDVVLNPNIPVKSIGGLSIVYDDHKNGISYELSGLSSIKTKRDNLIRLEAFASNISVRSIPVEDRPYNHPLPGAGGGRYGSVLFAKEVSSFMAERYKILNISMETSQPSIPDRLVKVVNGGMSQ
jgi:hypothetical protein